MRTSATAWASTAVIAWMRERVEAAGQDPMLIPDQPPAFWRLSEVERRVGLKRPTLYKMMASGRFPRPFAISPGHVPSPQADRPAA
jgi:predicted DNA-binding transcriptional regulator AlpA